MVSNRKMNTECSWCGEPITEDERNIGLNPTVMHRECQFRAVVGSVGHLLRRCSCSQPGVGLDDPPKLTKREAARASYDLFFQISAWFDDIRA
jgi:hypothetical protein